MWGQICSFFDEKGNCDNLLSKRKWKKIKKEKIQKQENEKKKLLKEKEKK